MHVAGERGHFGHRHLGVQRGEAVACAALAGEHLHALGVQPQQTSGELLRGGLDGVGRLGGGGVGDGGGAVL